MAMANTQTANKLPNVRERVERGLREGDAAEMGRDVVQYLREYARENPETTALWCFGIGFILGWKLKPW
jgi:hypothetical protein